MLIHRGISAYSGHYIAHVKDAHTGDWYKFNDEEIEKMEGKKLQLGLEEDIGKSHTQFFISMLVVQRLSSPLPIALIPKLGPREMWVVTLVTVRKLTALSVLVAHPGLPAETVKSQTRKPKCTKGSHCSRNAYMLVYKVQEEQCSDSCRTSVEVPGEQVAPQPQASKPSLLTSLRCCGLQLFFRGWWTKTTTNLRSGAVRWQT